MERTKKWIGVGMVIVFLGSCASSKSEAKKESEKMEECKKKDVVITLGTLGELGEVFNQFLGGRLDVFKEQPICYDYVKMEKYDKFFDDAFLTIAYFRLAQRIIKISSESIAQGIKADPNTDFVIAGAALYPLIKEAEPKVKSLIATTQSLLSSVKSDFVGLNARKIPNVTQNITMIADNLKAIAQEMGSIIEGLKKIGIPPSQ